MNGYLLPEPSKVLKVRRESVDTVTLDLALPHPSYSWLPGQFNMIYVFGKGEIPVSISGDPAARESITHTIRGVGAVSEWFLSAKAGDMVWLRGPYGAPWPVQGTARSAADQNNEDWLIIAGGLGLAPLRPVIISALRRTGPGRTILLYGARSEDDIIFREDFKQWQVSQHLLLKLALGRPFDASALSAPFDVKNVALGFVNQFLSQLALQPQKTTVYCCGPEVMMRHLATELVHIGVAAEKIFVSMERNMKCAVGMCGRCQWGSHFVCKDGPVYPFSKVESLITLKEF